MYGIGHCETPETGASHTGCTTSHTTISEGGVRANTWGREPQGRVEQQREIPDVSHHRSRAPTDERRYDGDLPRPALYR